MGANAALVQSAYDAFGRGDIAGVIEMLDDDVDWSAPKTLPHGCVFHGKAGVGEFFQGIGAGRDYVAILLLLFLASLLQIVPPGELENFAPVFFIVGVSAAAEATIAKNDEMISAGVTPGYGARGTLRDSRAVLARVFPDVFQLARVQQPAFNGLVAASFKFPLRARFFHCPVRQEFEIGKRNL